MTSLLRRALPGVALAALVWLTYSNSLSAGFTLDSESIVLESPRVQALSAENLGLIFGRDYWWPTNATGTYRPLTTLSYLINFVVLGNATEPAGYHWVNLILHWANALLVYGLGVAGLGLDRRAALLWAALFATHPVGPEAVTNIVGRADLFAAAAILGGLLLHVRAMRAAGRARAGWWLATAVVVGLGLFSKESAVAAVAVIVVYDLVFALEAPLAARGLGRAVARLAWPGWAVLVPPLALAFAARAWVQSSQPPLAADYSENALLGLDFWSARLTALKLLWRSLGVLVWPRTLCPDYSMNEIPAFGTAAGDWQAPAAAAVLAGLAGLAVWLARRGLPDGRRALFLAGFFVVTWLPTSNLLVLIPSTMAERFLYVPQIAFLGGAVLAIEALGRGVSAWLARTRPGDPPSAPGLRTALPSTVVLTAIVAAFAVRSHARNRDWQNDLALWTSAIESCPGSFQSHLGFATALVAADPTGTDAAVIDRAIAEGETAEAILERGAPPQRGASGVALEHLGAFYLRKARILAAAPVRDPGAVETSTNKAIDALERSAAWYREENERHRAALAARGPEVEPGFEVGVPNVYENLGNALLLGHRPEDALAAFAHLRRLAPGSADAYAGTSVASAMLGRPEDALVALLEALIVDPSRADLAGRLVETYRRVEPIGCAFTEREGKVMPNPSCPSLRRYACRAYAEVERAFLESPATPGETRRAAIEALRKTARETFRCSGGEIASGAPAASRNA